jgi:hypothetical protein
MALFWVSFVCPHVALRLVPIPPVTGVPQNKISNFKEMSGENKEECSKRIVM